MSIIFKILVISITAVIINMNVDAQKTKNIIVMIGDGMGFNHISAANNYYDKTQEYEKWNKLRVSTYCKDGFYNSDSAYNDFNFVKRRYTDSGAAATALACGYKTHQGVIGLNENYYSVKNLTEYAEETEKSTGLITTVPFNHATPAGYVAHVENREFYHEIASQMLIESKLEVIMGCGNPYYDENATLVKSGDYKYIPSEMLNDIQSGKTEITNHLGEQQKLKSCDADKSPDVWTLINSVEEFNSIAKGEKLFKRVFGFPNVYSTLQANRSTNELNENLPDLEMMSLAALNILNQNKIGFFLMIEGGAIDWASHDSLFIRTIEETYDFNKAVAAVTKWVEENSNWEETIVIITADHETGYLTNTSITGDEYNKMKSKSDKTTLPENKKNSIDLLKFNQPGYPYVKCNHTNQLVPLFFKGSGSEMFDKKVEEYKIRKLNYDKLSNSTYIDNTDIANILIKLINKY